MGTNEVNVSYVLWEQMKLIFHMFLLAVHLSKGTNEKHKKSSIYAGFNDFAYYIIKFYIIQYITQEKKY